MHEPDRRSRPDLRAGPRRLRLGMSMMDLHKHEAGNKRQNQSSLRSWRIWSLDTTSESTRPTLHAGP